MPRFRVKVVRVSRVEETGYHEIEANSRDEAEEEAAEMDDPDDMVETKRATENWECSAERIDED